MELNIDLGEKQRLTVFVKSINREHLGTSIHDSIDVIVNDDSLGLINNWFKTICNLITQNIGYPSVYKKIGYTDTCKIRGLWISSINHNYNTHLIELKLEFDEIKEYKNDR